VSRVDRSDSILVRRDETGYENDAVQSVHLGNFFRQTQMRQMRRIEGSTEESNFQRRTVFTQRACIGWERSYIELGRLERRNIQRRRAFTYAGKYENTIRGQK
jgi:hypothetical protein